MFVAVRATSICVALVTFVVNSLCFRAVFAIKTVLGARAMLSANAMNGKRARVGNSFTMIPRNSYYGTRALLAKFAVISFIPRHLYRPEPLLYTTTGLHTEGPFKVSMNMEVVFPHEFQQKYNLLKALIRQPFKACTLQARAFTWKRQAVFPTEDS